LACSADLFVEIHVVLQAIRDFIKVITPSTPNVATWKLKWLLQLDYDTNLNRPKPLRISSVCTSSTGALVFNTALKNIAHCSLFFMSTECMVLNIACVQSDQVVYCSP
jgi:hypothetical protein